MAWILLSFVLFVTSDCVSSPLYFSLVLVVDIEALLSSTAFILLYSCCVSCVRRHTASATLLLYVLRPVATAAVLASSAVL